MIDRAHAPVSLRISVTDRCQHRCVYCLPADGVELVNRQEMLGFEQIRRFVRVVTSHVPVKKVHLTGGEPLLRRGIEDLVAMLAADGVSDLALTTNGRHLARRAESLKQAGLHRVNVSLDSIDEGRFSELTRGGRLSETLAGIEAAVAAGLAPVKLNAVVLRGINDTQVNDLARWAIDHGCAIRFLEMMPIGCARARFDELFVPATETRTRLNEAFVLEPMASPPSGTSRDFVATDAHGRRGQIGFIASQGHPFCDACRRLRLTSTGQLIGCLARGQGPNVRELLCGPEPAADEALGQIVLGELAGKSTRKSYETNRAMSSVGG